MPHGKRKTELIQANIQDGCQSLQRELFAVVQTPLLPYTCNDIRVSSISKVASDDMANYETFLTFCFSYQPLSQNEIAFPISKPLPVTKLSCLDIALLWSTVSAVFFANPKAKHIPQTRDSARELLIPKQQGLIYLHEYLYTCRPAESLNSPILQATITRSQPSFRSPYRL